MTKTEKTILDEITDRGSVSVEYGRARGSWKGSFRPVEIRRGNACRSLAAKGLVTIVRDESASARWHDGGAFEGRWLIVEAVAS